MIKIIRKSDGKEDAAAKLMKRFELDEIQTDAILDMRLYKLAAWRSWWSRRRRRRSAPSRRS